MIGRWIDSLTDAERDAIITHPDPTFEGDRWWAYPSDLSNCGCLVGTVIVHRRPELAGNWSAICLATGRVEFYVGNRFPQLTARFGPERVWAACKARAAKRNRVALPETECVPQ